MHQLTAQNEPGVYEESSHLQELRKQIMNAVAHEFSNLFPGVPLNQI